MNTSIEQNINELNRSSQQGSDYLWHKYEDALYEISKLREELSRKDTQIESLTETIVQMSIELATAKAKEDEFGMKLRRASVVESIGIGEAPTAAVENKESHTQRRNSCIGRGSNLFRHSNSIAVQNPITQRRTSTTTRPRHKSDSWASRSSNVDEIDVEKLDSVLRSKLQLFGFRMGWGLEGELDNSRADSKSESSVGVQDPNIHKGSPPTKGSPGRRIGSFVRNIGLSQSNANTARFDKEKADQRGENSDESPISLRKKGKSRDGSGLNSSCVVFPVASSDLLSAFLEVGGQNKNATTRNCYHSSSVNEEWPTMQRN
ncbi:hypothetical protein HJC23_007923 [Cyclotella cryptica]|uniref:Uncharacterized protein n=1 Tax=Cyclotella cryptica TaxID=29204 RepID=A0ABD3P072_9STRA